jgi:putative endonuclease
MGFFCYIVQCVDGTFYTGWTTDPERRVRQHNRGKGAKYTRQHGPVRLVYLEAQPDRSTAMQRERKIKTYSRDQKMKLIESQKHE